MTLIFSDISPLIFLSLELDAGVNIINIFTVQYVRLITGNICICLNI